MRNDDSNDWRKRKRNPGGSVYTTLGKLWVRVQYQDANGKRRERRVEIESGKRKDARKKITALRKSLEQDGPVALEKYNATFGELAAAYKQTRLQPAVIRNGIKASGLKSWKTPTYQLKSLVEYFGERTHLRTITKAKVEDFKRDRLNTETRNGKERSLASVHREIALLRTMLNFAEEQNWLAKAPSFKGLITKENNERSKTLTFAQEQRLLAQCVGRRKHLKNILILALETCLRRRELLTLEWADVDFTAGVIRARATNTKTEKAREIAISERAREALSELCAAAPAGYTGRIFPYSELGSSFEGACKDAGITGLRWHDLRHSGISRRVQAGQPHPQIMRVSGHSEFRTFTRYVNQNEETHREDAETYSAYVRAQLAKLELEKQQEMAEHESEAVN